MAELLKIKDLSVSVEEKVRGWKKALEASFGFGKED